MNNQIGYDKQNNGGDNQPGDDTYGTVVDGEGLLAIEGKITPVKRGDTVCILQDMRHGLKAINDLTLIETQTGSDLLEDDVELFDWNWQK